LPIGSRLLFGALALLACAAPASALAQSQRPAGSAAWDAAAQRSFDAGLEHFKVRDFGGAATLFKQALASTGSPNAALLLARCLIEQKDVAAGYEMMRRAMTDARTMSAAVPEYAKTYEAAKAELAALAPRVGLVTLTLPSAPAGARIKLNGQPLELARIGDPVAIAPGHVVVVVSAPGHEEASWEADVAAGESKDAQLSLGRPTVEEGGPSSAPSSPDGAGPSGMRKAGFVVAGVGIVGLGLFIGAGVAASADYDKLKSECGGHCTDPSYDSVISRGKSLETVSNVGLVVGIAGVVGGGALILLGGSRAKQAASIRATPIPGGAGLLWTGGF
jgi:hypothetical protein